MSLSINWQQGMAGNSPFAIGAENQIGKLNTKAVSLIDSSNLRTNGLDSVSAAANISMDDFLSTIRDNLLSLNMQDNNGQAKDVAPLVQAFKSTINQLEEAFGKSVADMANILQAVDLYSRFVEDKNGALAAINEFRGNHKEAFGRQVSLGNLTESELAEYNTLNEKWSDIHQGYNQKSNELYVKILAEMKQ